MKITETQLRKIIKKELLREMRHVNIPILVADLEFVPDKYGSMMLPGLGFRHGVKEEDFEDWKIDTMRKFGNDVTISHNGLGHYTMHGEKFAAAQKGENEKFMTHHRGMEKRLGRKLSY